MLITNTLQFGQFVDKLPIQYCPTDLNPRSEVFSFLQVAYCVGEARGEVLDHVPEVDVIKLFLQEIIDVPKLKKLKNVCSDI